MSHAHCCKLKASSALAQSLDEMEFERGIWSAASDGDLPKIQHFLQKGVHPDIQDAAGYTALHYAALKGFTDICRLLLEYGADINAVTKAGKATALHRAATKGNRQTVELLLEKGASVTLQDADGQTALHRAILNQHVELAKLLSVKYPVLLSITDHKHKLPADYQ